MNNVENSVIVPKNTFESKARFQKIHICYFSVKSQHETKIRENAAVCSPEIEAIFSPETFDPGTEPLGVNILEVLLVFPDSAVNTTFSTLV